MTFELLWLRTGFSSPFVPGAVAPFPLPAAATIVLFPGGGAPVPLFTPAGPVLAGGLLAPPVVVSCGRWMVCVCVCVC